MTEPTIIKAKSRRARPKLAELPEDDAAEHRSADTLTLKIKSRGISEHAEEPQDTGRMIAEAAYYRAEKRGFAPGREIEDWVEAEQEVRALRDAHEEHA